MDFWRAYRVLVARRWLILGVVLLTTTVVGLGILSLARKYDAQTSFGPTAEAMRAAINAGNDPKNLPVLTEDAKMEEAKRIYEQVKAPDNVYNAVLYLANARLLKQGLEESLKGSSVPGKPEALYEQGARPNYASIKYKLDPPNDGLPHKIPKDLAGSGIPKSAWTDFIYLLAVVEEKDNAISEDFISPARINETYVDLINNIEVTPLNSRDIVLSVRDRVPVKAEVLASALTAAYKSAYDDRNLTTAQSAVNYFTAQQNQAARQMSAAQSALDNFRRTHKDIFLPDQVSLAIKNKDTTRQDVDSMNVSLGDLDAQIKAKQARLVSLPRMLKHPAQADSGEISSLRDKISTLNASIAEKSAVWTDRNPEMVRMRDQLKALQNRLKKVEGSLVTTTTYTENDEYLTLDREIAKLKQSRDGLSARLARLNTVMADRAKLIADLPDTYKQSITLAGQASSAAERLQEVGKKLKASEEALELTKAQGSLEVRFWAGRNPADKHPETRALEGSVKRNWTMFIAAILLSLIGSAGVILALDFLDTSVKSAVDVERMLDVPVNGVVPRLDGPNRGMLAQVTHKLPSSPQAESYRFLGTDILLSAAGDEPFKTIMVATAKPGQGGTSTICNLAITLAQAGQTVVLVDADLRRPSLHNVFNVPNDLGLTTVLSNGKLPSDVLQRTEIENLYVMPGGPKAENAWKLLRSVKMKEVIADLQRDFDFVLFDTPSAVVFADAATLATMVDGVLLVVRANEAPSGSEMQVKNLLNKTRARIVGVVLNDMPLQQVDSARYFAHYYGTSARPEIGSTAAAASAKPALPKRGSDDEI
ncbi:MAG TPA: polysaccharide biosynthesis tyrosine autokinase [Armatimonadota bacterium]|jgi:capsular exopolysaccharide synthesis family protein